MVHIPELNNDSMKTLLYVLTLNLMPEFSLKTVTV